LRATGKKQGSGNAYKNGKEGDKDRRAVAQFQGRNHGDLLPEAS
jgi:hypothetical protein